MGGNLETQSKTKIIVTLGPAVDSYSAVLSLIKAGASAARLNFSHGNQAQRKKQIEWVRKASKVTDKPVAIIGDLQGPKLRLGDFDDMLNIPKGRVVSLKAGADYAQEGHIPLEHDISNHVKRGHRLLISDGRLAMRVQAIKDGVVYAAAENEGILIRRKGINLPDTDFSGEIITEKDRKDLVFIAEQKLDYVALSFTQKASDISRLKRLSSSLGSSAKIIAKIETRAAVDDLESITEEADALIVARGDLAVETSPEEVPIIERRVLAIARNHAKPSIVATQLLASMVSETQPTNAEVSDLSAAVLLGADAVILADETASGKHPLETVKTAQKVLLFAESHNLTLQAPATEATEQQSAVCRATVNLAGEVSATAIIAETKSGATAGLLSAGRPKQPILAITNSWWTANQLSIFYGVVAYLRPNDKYAAKKLTAWLKSKKVFKKGDLVIICSGQYPGVVGSTDTIKVRQLD